jgi:hypothetical protein
VESNKRSEKLLKKAFVPTNWRLMSDGVTYRLGFLRGRLRGIESEEKLKELLESEQKKRDKKLSQYAKMRQGSSRVSFVSFYPQNRDPRASIHSSAKTSKKSLNGLIS